MKKTVFGLAVEERSDVTVVYYCFEGVVGSWYEGGQYFGKIVLPEDFPHSGPKEIQCITPSGRFHTNMSLCLTVVSPFYRYQWNPTISLYKVAIMIQIYMTTPYETMTGGINSTEEVTRAFARASAEWNAQHPMFQSLFQKLILSEKVEKENM